ncbi:flagellar protein FliT [Virgibacillus sp. L01]|uniref:flagellar protein FliT n=1 Tax=Virgibacillus sp. L01 TaxID=3457429 RepID=UPI003FD2C47C
MNQLQETYDVTKQLEEVLNEKIDAKDRDAVIAQVNRLVEQRGDLLSEITPPYSEAEKQLGKELVKLNEQIQEKMNSLFDDLKVEMKQVKKQKKSNRTYVNPYENVKTNDGMYMDSKK